MFSLNDNKKSEETTIVVEEETENDESLEIDTSDIEANTNNNIYIQSDNEQVAEDNSIELSDYKQEDLKIVEATNDENETEIDH